MCRAIDCCQKEHTNAHNAHYNAHKAIGKTGIKERGSMKSNTREFRQQQQFQWSVGDFGDLRADNCTDLLACVCDCCVCFDCGFGADGMMGMSFRIR